MSILQTFITTADDSGMMGRFAPFMESIVEDITEELSEKDEAGMAEIMAKIGSVIGWIGHGDNTQLPEELRMFADSVQPNGNTTPDPIRVAGRDSGNSQQPSGVPDMGDASAYPLASQAR